MESNIQQRFSMLDTKLGLSYCLNDEEFYLEMIETYIEGDKRAEIKESYESGDWNTYGTHVHALKSMSLNIGAQQLSEKAKALEFAADEENIEYIKEHNDEVMKEYSLLLQHLAQNCN